MSSAKNYHLNVLQINPLDQPQKQRTDMSPLFSSIQLDKTGSVWQYPLQVKMILASPL